MNVKYDRIGINYNQTRQADKYLAERLYSHLQPQKDRLYLDIGCGTGNYTDALQKRGIRMLGIDPSEKMLSEAKHKNAQVDWRIGTAEKTGLQSESISGITAFLTIHHWSNLKTGFSELSRVLTKNGRIVIFTSTPEQMNGYWLNHYFPKMLADSKKQMPDYSLVCEAMEAAGLRISETEKYFVRPDQEDYFLYSGKNRPELYLMPQIRNGISSFSDLANQKEVEAGLKQLQKDIESGKIREIISKYENDKGDYLFIIGGKAEIEFPQMNNPNAE